MSFFISPAFAQEGAAAQGSALQPLIMLLIFAAVFYFLIWRPQSKRAKEHKNLLSGLEKGDEVVTGGGVVGKVVKVTDNFLVLEIAEGVHINLQKVAVANVLPKGTIKSI